MQPEERDLSYLWDMRKAAREIAEFMQGVSYESFKDDKKLRYAIERQLLVIGEAAAHISNNLKEKHPEIPWVQIIGQRNVLAHDYGEILVDRVWLTATKSLPVLLIDLEKLVS